MTARAAGRPTVVVTYNRMLKRLLTLLDKGGVIPTTMHAFVGDDYRDRFGGKPPIMHDEYSYDWQEILSRFHQRGIQPYLSHIVVDEGQDLPAGFHAYLQRHCAEVLTVFADENQALSDQRTTLEQIRKSTGLDHPILLKHNHRNTPEVSRLAVHFHSGRLPATKDVKEPSGILPRLERTRGIDHTASMVANWYMVRGGSIGVIVFRNDTGKQLYQLLKQHLTRTRVDIYLHERQNEADTNVREDGVTVINKESVKGQEFDWVYILELERFIPCQNDVEKRTMYMMCSRARENLNLVYGPAELSPAADRSLPGPTILERNDKESK